MAGRDALVEEEPMVRILSWRCIDCGCWADYEKGCYDPRFPIGYGWQQKAPTDYKLVMEEPVPAALVRGGWFACGNNDCMSHNILYETRPAGGAAS